MTHVEQPQTNKPNPKATPEVAEMLNFASSETAVPATSAAPGNLPVVEVAAAHDSADHSAPTSSEHHAEAHSAHTADHEEVVEENFEDETPKSRSVVKTVLPYIAIFAVGIFLYYFYFSTFSFSSVTDLFKKNPVKNVVTQVTDQASALEQLKQANLDNYYAYMNQFYFDTSDSSVLDPDADNSGNGLTNFQKFILGLNPKTYDTLGNGQADSMVLAEGLDPVTGQPLSDKRKELVDNFLDLEAASNRLAHSSINGQQAATPSTSGTVGNLASAIFGARNAGATSAAKAVSPVVTNGAVAGATVSQRTAPATGPTNYANVSSTPGSNAVEISDSVNATLEIPALKISVPIIWTKDTKNFEKDLESGVVHYPGTALPGQRGTAYISGHSSNYSWKAGNYKRIFATINNLKNGDSFTITATDRNGKQVKLHYVVSKKQEYKADDQAQFANTEKSIVALSTCWPLNTTAKRLVVFGQLTQVEK